MTDLQYVSKVLEPVARLIDDCTDESVLVQMPPIGSIAGMPLLERLGSTVDGKEFIRVLTLVKGRSVSNTRIMVREPGDKYFHW